MKRDHWPRSLALSLRCPVVPFVPTVAVQGFVVVGVRQHRLKNRRNIEKAAIENSFWCSLLFWYNWIAYALAAKSSAHRAAGPSVHAAFLVLLWQTPWVFRASAPGRISKVPS